MNLQNSVGINGVSPRQHKMRLDKQGMYMLVEDNRTPQLSQQGLLARLFSGWSPLLPDYSSTGTSIKDFFTNIAKDPQPENIMELWTYYEVILPIHKKPLQHQNLHTFNPYDSKSVSKLWLTSTLERMQQSNELNPLIYAGECPKTISPLSTLQIFTRTNPRKQLEEVIGSLAYSIIKEKDEHNPDFVPEPTHYIKVYGVLYRNQND